MLRIKLYLACKSQNDTHYRKYMKNYTSNTHLHSVQTNTTKTGSCIKHTKSKSDVIQSILTIKIFNRSENQKDMTVTF